MAAQTSQRVAVVTGASSGIGKEVAKSLAAQGFRVIAIGRDPDRSAAAEHEIRSAAKQGAVHMLRGDLALLVDAARIAREIGALTDPVDVLVNNAGGMAKEKVITAEGLEQNFAGNHLGPFLLTQRLLPLLKRAASSAPRGSVRIVNTASDASEMVPGLDWDNLQGLNDFNAGRSYCRAKLANVMFARGLASRLATDGIVAHAVHPGTVATNFFSYADAATQERMQAYPKHSPQEGADTLIWAATAPEAGEDSGGYFYQRKPRAPSPFAMEDANVDRLWNDSEQLILGVPA